MEQHSSAVACEGDKPAAGALSPANAPSLGDDLLWGVDAIAAELNLTKRQAYYQLEAGSLPARKQMGRWIASRRGLRDHFASLFAGEVA